MKLFITAIFALYCNFVSAFTEAHAKQFLKANQCDFSAYMVNKHNEVFPFVVCAESFNEQHVRAVNPHKYCAFQMIDLRTEQYTGIIRRGEPQRYEREHCNHNNLKTITSRARAMIIYKQITKMQGGTWTIVDDKFGIQNNFKDAIK